MKEFVILSIFCVFMLAFCNANGEGRKPCAERHCAAGKTPQRVQLRGHFGFSCVCVELAE